MVVPPVLRESRFYPTSSSSAFRAGWRRLPHPLRWIAVALTGGAVLATGLVFLVLPGPGLPLVVLGLVILATEFTWASRTLHHVKHRSRKVMSTLTRRSTRKDTTP